MLRWALGAQRSALSERLPTSFAGVVAVLASVGPRLTGVTPPDPEQGELAIPKPLEFRENRQHRLNRKRKVLVGAVGDATPLCCSKEVSTARRRYMIKRVQRGCLSRK